MFSNFPFSKVLFFVSVFSFFGATSQQETCQPPKPIPDKTIHIVVKRLETMYRETSHERFYRVFSRESGIFDVTSEWGDKHACKMYGKLTVGMRCKVTIHKGSWVCDTFPCIRNVEYCRNINSPYIR